MIWKHGKNRKTRVRELLKRGVSRAFAVATGCARKGPWHMRKVKDLVGLRYAAKKLFLHYNPANPVNPVYSIIIFKSVHGKQSS